MYVTRLCQFGRLCNKAEESCKLCHKTEINCHTQRQDKVCPKNKGRLCTNLNTNRYVMSQHEMLKLS